MESRIQWTSHPILGWLPLGYLDTPLILHSYKYSSQIVHSAGTILSTIDHLDPGGTLPN